MTMMMKREECRQFTHFLNLCKRVMSTWQKISASFVLQLSLLYYYASDNNNNNNNKFTMIFHVSLISSTNFFSFIFFHFFIVHFFVVAVNMLDFHWNFFLLIRTFSYMCLFLRTHISITIVTDENVFYRVSTQ